MWLSPGVCLPGVVWLQGLLANCHAVPPRAPGRFALPVCSLIYSDRLGGSEIFPRQPVIPPLCVTCWAQDLLRIFAPFYVTLAFCIFWFIQPLVQRFVVQPLIALVDKVRSACAGLWGAGPLGPECWFILSRPGSLPWPVSLGS